MPLVLKNNPALKEQMNLKARKFNAEKKVTDFEAKIIELI